MLDDLLAADALAQRAVDLINYREAGESVDVMSETDAIASVSLATVAVSKRLAVVADAIERLIASIDRLALDRIRADLHREQTERARLEGEVEELQARLDAAREDDDA